VYRVKEVHKGRDGSLKEGMQRTYTRHFDVYMTSRLDGQLEAIFAVDPFTGESVPRLYASYFSFGTSEFDLFAVCRSITATQDDDDWQVWHVACEYGTTNADLSGHPETGDGSGFNPKEGGAGDNLDLEPASVEWGYWTREEVQRVEARAEYDAILNSAKQPFDPLPTREVGGLVLTYERNELTFDAWAMTAYAFTVNSEDFLEEGDFRQWLCKPVTARKVWKGNFSYYRVRYEFHHTDATAKDGVVPIGWDHYLLDCGWMQLNAAGKPVPIVNVGQTAASVPLLDGAGKVLDPPITTDKIKYLSYAKYRERSFAPLKIVID